MTYKKIDNDIVEKTVVIPQRTDIKKESVTMKRAELKDISEMIERLKAQKDILQAELAEIKKDTGIDVT